VDYKLNNVFLHFYSFNIKKEIKFTKYFHSKLNFIALYYMSFFQSIGGYQSYLQNALQSASNNQALEEQSTDNEQSMQNEDNIANEALKSAGLSDLFLGSPLAIKAISEGKGIYSRAKASYADIKESYNTIKARTADLKDFLTTAPDKLQQLKDASLGADMTPEALTAKMTELFGEKYAKSAVGKIIMNKVDEYKKGFEDLKGKLGEHLEAGNELHSRIEAGKVKLGDILNRPAEQLSVQDLDVASHFKNILEKAHGVIGAGVNELEAKKTALVEGLKNVGKGEGAEELVSRYSVAKINKDFERMKGVASKAVSDGGEVIQKMAEASPLAEVRTAARAAPMPAYDTTRKYETTPSEFRNPLFNEGAADEPVSTRFIAKDFSRVEPTISAPRNVVSGGLSYGSPFDYAHAAVEGVGKVPVLPAEAKDVLSAFDNFKAKAGSAYDAAKSAFTSLGESALGKVSKAVGGTAVEALNLYGGIQGVQGLAKGNVNISNVLQAQTLKGAPEAVGEVAGYVQKGVSSISKSAGETLSSYAERAKQGVSETMDLIKSSISSGAEKAGAAIGEGVGEKVGEGVAEKGLGELGLEAGLATIPVAGEILDIGLGIGSIVSAVKDLFNKPDKPVAAPTIVQGAQISRQAGVY